MFTKNIFNQKDGIADLVGNILEADYKNKVEELKGDQHKIDKNKNGKIDSHDFKILRGEKTMQKEAAAMPHYTDDSGNQYHYGASGYVSVKNKSGIDQGQRHLNDMSAVHKKNYEKVHGMAWNQKNEEVELEEGSTSKEKQKTPYRDIKSPEYKAAADKQKEKMKQDAATDSGKKLLNKIMSKSKNEEVEKKKENPFDALMKAAKERQGPQPSGGSGMKKGTRYGGSRQKDVKEEVELDEGSKHAARPRSASRPGTEPPVKGKLQDRMAAARARMDAKKKDMKEEVEDVAEASNGLYQKAIRKHAERVAHDYLGGGDEHLYGANKFDAEMHGVSRERANKDFKTLFNKIVSSQAVSAKKKDVKEDVEQIDELNKDTVYSYNKKSISATGKLDKQLGSQIRSGNASDANKTAHKLNKRLAGQERADARLNKEEVEGVAEGSEQVQIDEIKLRNIIPGLGKQIAKSRSQTKRDQARLAGIDARAAGHPEPRFTGDYPKDTPYDDVRRERDRHHKRADRYDRIAQGKSPFGKSQGKEKGVHEDVEQVDERTLTKGETAERERIVKGMKKSLAGFKSRYGDKAKSVMYATATKAAKKD